MAYVTLGVIRNLIKKFKTIDLIVFEIFGNKQSLSLYIMVRFKRVLNIFEILHFLRITIIIDNVFLTYFQVIDLILKGNDFTLSFLTSLNRRNLITL